MRQLREEVEELLTNLTDEEFNARARQLARAVQDVASLEAHQRDVKAQQKAELTKLEAERERLGLVVARCAELRDVRVQVMADDVNKLVITYRTDSGEEVRRREMRDSERQLPMFVEPSEAVEEPAVNTGDGAASE